MLSKSVILIGMPGSGKTTIGRHLAGKIGSDFVDTDMLVISKAGKPLQDVISQDGMEAFKALEKQTLIEYIPEKPSIIATGGSAVLYEEAMKHFKELGTIVFLDADLPLIEKRLWNAESRGIAFSSDKGESDTDNKILEVYMEREPLYYKYSDVRVHVRGKTVSDIGEEIINSIEV